ncbi:hypothetical protein GXW78_06195 [Roseomonas terrae]|uniref:HTH cro/C1-type domain-containing protein n=1 Tax=Neoroseomonas terrae TaxID=424799 RepID=A0ABS5EE09_9PROT|nr:antitoxin Xre-like helix-turn-helix domain-containing protein [Neoroseomonas terrae]MBR0649244.1 hypothetical protein [Neoroseomonas terrae]
MTRLLGAAGERQAAVAVHAVWKRHEGPINEPASSSQLPRQSDACIGYGELTAVLVITQRGAALWRAADKRQNHAALVLLGGLTQNEAARTMGVSIATFKRVLRSRERLDKAAEYAASAVSTLRGRSGW